MALSSNTAPSGNRVNSASIAASVEVLLGNNQEIPIASAWSNLAKETGVKLGIKFIDLKSQIFNSVYISAAKLENFAIDPSVTTEKIRPIIEAVTGEQIKLDKKGDILKVLVALSMPYGSTEIQELALKKLEALKADKIEDVLIDNAREYRRQKISDREIVSRVLADFTFTPYREAVVNRPENATPDAAAQVGPEDKTETTLLTKAKAQQSEMEIVEGQIIEKLRRVLQQ